MANSIFTDFFFFGFNRINSFVHGFCGVQVRLTWKGNCGWHVWVLLYGVLRWQHLLTFHSDVATCQSGPSTNERTDFALPSFSCTAGSPHDGNIYIFFGVLPLNIISVNMDMSPENRVFLFRKKEKSWFENYFLFFLALLVKW